MENGGAVALALAVAAGVYFLPSIIAVSRRHKNATALLVLNLLLGWTLLGWVAALVWSFISQETARPQHDPPSETSFTYFGQTVSLHRATGRARVAGRDFSDAEAAKAYIDQTRATPPPAPARSFTILHGGRQILVNTADGTASVDGLNFASPADAQTYIDRLQGVGKAGGQ